MGYIQGEEGDQATLLRVVLDEFAPADHETGGPGCDSRDLLKQNYFESVELARPSAEVYANARFMLLMASSISPVLLNPIVAQSTPAFRKANFAAFTRSSWLFWN